MFHLKHARGSVCGLQACDWEGSGLASRCPFFHSPTKKKTSKYLCYDYYILWLLFVLIEVAMLDFRVETFLTVCRTMNTRAPPEELNTHAAGGVAAHRAP